MSKEISPYMRLPLGWREKDEVIDLPPGGQVLLLVLVEYCQVRRNGGVMSEKQVRAICKTVERGHRSLALLVAAGVLKTATFHADHEHTTDSPSTHREHTTDSPLHNQRHTTAQPRAHQPGVIPSVCRRCADGESVVSQRYAIVRPSYWFISGAPAAGQGPDEVPRARERAGARVGALVRREERVEEENRPPSGSGRFSSARAAPRVASGAARPAPKEEKDSEENAVGESGDLDAGGDSLAEDGPRMSKSEAMKSIRKAIGKSSMSSGKPTQMRKYPMELNSLSEPSLPVELNGRYE